MNVPQEQLKLACCALQSAIPELTPAILASALEIGLDQAKERIDLVSVNQAAQILNVCPMTVYRRGARGEIKTYPVGKGRTYRLNRYELMGAAS